MTLTSFLGSPFDFAGLVDAVWHDGHARPGAASAVPEIRAALATAPADRAGRLAVLLGLLAETGDPCAAAVREGIGDYLGRLARHADDPRVYLPLVYLLAHFPQDREVILAAVGDLALPLGEQTRLERLLRQFDPNRPELGRVWPAPSAWRLTEEEREVDRRWIASLPADRVTSAWANDSLALMAYAGTRALWAAEHGAPHPASEPVTDSAPDAGAGAVPAEPAWTGAGNPIRRYADLLRCPACEAGVRFGDDSVDCRRCGRHFPLEDDYLDLSAGAGDATASATQNIPLRYEQALRPAFIQLMGTNWGNVVSLDDEDAYLIREVDPADGPVLDLAAGSGRWAQVLAAHLGADRVIGLDLSSSMLTRLHAAAPQVAAVRASALNLPFGDATLGAVNCWNAMQALPDPRAAIAEVGRCLIPGGSFTALTFRPSPDPVYRHLATRPRGVVIFDPDILTDWLTEAGLKVRTLETPETFVFVTAVRA